MKLLSPGLGQSSSPSLQSQEGGQGEAKIPPTAVPTSSTAKAATSGAGFWWWQSSPGTQGAVHSLGVSQQGSRELRGIKPAPTRTRGCRDLSTACSAAEVENKLAFSSTPWRRAHEISSFLGLVLRSWRPEKDAQKVRASRGVSKSMKQYPSDLPERRSIGR